jgi:hypothetical protein
MIQEKRIAVEEAVVQVAHHAEAMGELLVVRHFDPEISRDLFRMFIAISSLSCFG